MTRITLIIFFCISATLFGQEYNGIIKNRDSDSSITFANVLWKKKQIGTVADVNGEFSIPFITNDTLVVSAIGFKISNTSTNDLPKDGTFYLSPETEILEYVQIEINRKKKRRSRKVDPAYRLHKKIAKRREQNDLKNRDYYKCDVYNKLEIDLNNVDSNTKHLLLFKPISFVFEKPDTLTLKKKFSPIFLSEGYSNYYFKKPEEEREVVFAAKNAGVEIPSIAQYTGNVYTDFNIYSSYIRLFQKQFISPLAPASWLSYNYYLTDSVTRNDSIYYRLDFLPRRQQDFAFEGYLIVNNKSFGVHEIELRIPERCNINFVEEFIIKQKYNKHDSILLLNDEKTLIDINPWGNTYGFYIQKKTQWLNYDLDSDMPKGVFLSTQKTAVNDSAYEKGEELLNNLRPNPLKLSEVMIYKRVDSAMSTPYLKALENLSIMAYSGYYPLKFWEFGPYYNTFSFNDIEGNRYRFGGQTTQNLLKETRFRGHFAYGDIDKIFKFRGQITKFFNFKKWRYLEFDYLNDYKLFGNGEEEFKEDDIFSSLTRRVTPKFTYSKRARLKWFHEWQNGVNNSIELTTENLAPIGDLVFKKQNGEVLSQLDFHTLKIGGRLALNERFLSYGFRRLSLSTTKPRFNYYYTYGAKVSNSGFEFHKLEIEMTDRYLFGFFGFLDVKLFGSKIWGNVPYPILLNHKGNNSYYLDKEVFNLMNPFEFTSDQQISILSKYNFNGLLMNRIAYLKRLNLRSFIFSNSVYGTLSPDHENLILFPDGLSSLYKPYLEIGFGVENIFNLIRLDFIWRVNNLTYSTIERFGISFSLEPSF